MRKLNKDYKTRNKILGIPDAASWFGGSEKIQNVDLNTVKLLIQSGFVELEEAQNDSPTTQQFLNFMEKYPDVKAHGYAVSHKRDDYRITLEGLMCELSEIQPERREEIREAFRKFCRKADNLLFLGVSLYSWWD